MVVGTVGFVDFIVAVDAVTLYEALLDDFIAVVLVVGPLLVVDCGSTTVTAAAPMTLSAAP